METNPLPTVASTPVMARPRIPAWLMAVLLVLVTIALYWPATHHDFVNYDDELFVTSNVRVQKGLTWENLTWAFRNPVAGNWHPATVLSHMVDCQIFGLKPWGHHLTSVLLHALNTLLVFLLLHRLTGAFWRSVLVAALFGWHPVHVESVAWVAERKDVLSTCFGLLALIFYARYAQSKIANRQSPIANYAVALLFFALGLMSKPMLVTWPFVMLLLDYWPLGRFAIDDWRLTSLRSFLSRGPWSAVRGLVCEKLPFFLLAAAACVVTFMVQKGSGAVTPGETLPLGARAGNALVSYCRYLGKLLWPTDMAVFYPHPGYWPMTTVLLAGALLLGVSLLLLALRRRHPSLLLGWLWYLGTLVPVIGLVQVGGHAMADRYAYIPALGVLLSLIWGACELARRWRHQVPALAVAGSAAIIVSLALTRQQLGHWRDSEALFRHALAVTENNQIAHNNLGTALLKQGRDDEAISTLREAVRLDLEDATARYNLGIALVRQGQLDEAINELQTANRLNPGDAATHSNLGDALLRQGKIDEAISRFREALRLKPEDAATHYNLGIALEKQDRTEEATNQYREALRLNPDDAEARKNLGIILIKQGQTDEAIRQFQENIRLKPDDAAAHSNLGNALGLKGRVDEAIHQYREALRLKPDSSAAHNNLGNALAMKGRMDEAIRQFQNALRLDPEYADAQRNLAAALALKGEPGGASAPARKP